MISLNPKETLNNLFHNKNQEEKPLTNTAEEAADSQYTVESDNLAIPEVHTKDHEQKMKDSETEQNRSNKKEDVVFDTLAIPEIHIKK